MLVVSNTSPILNLAIIDRLALLHEQFGEVIIPSAVQDELKVDSDLPGSIATAQALVSGWLRVESAQDQMLVRVLQRDLDKGEAEAIALAVQLNAAWVLLDEREGRKVAQLLGLRVTGVLGILLRACREGELSSMQEAIEELRDKAGFYINPVLAADLIKEAGNISA